tara:strand:+ start:599 stop:1195 length:597 start_codon:yes stop_codon:yes gene_type:complete
MAKIKVGTTLETLKKQKKGLLGDLLLAKLEASKVLIEQQEAVDDGGQPIEPEVTEAGLLEATLTRDAILKFLTHKDLNWTIAELKASLEVEEFETMSPLNAQVSTNVNTTVSPGISVMTSGGGGATTSTGAGAGTGAGIVNEPIQLRKDGAKHGGRLKAVGHAYIGEPDIVPNSDTTDSQNDFTKVKLYENKIPKELL